MSTKLEEGLAPIVEDETTLKVADTDVTETEAEDGITKEDKSTLTEMGIKEKIDQETENNAGLIKLLDEANEKLSNALKTIAITQGVLTKNEKALQTAQLEVKGLQINTKELQKKLNNKRRQIRELKEDMKHLEVKLKNRDEYAETDEEDSGNSNSKQKNKSTTSKRKPQNTGEQLNGADDSTKNKKRLSFVEKMMGRKDKHDK